LQSSASLDHRTRMLLKQSESPVAFVKHWNKFLCANSGGHLSIQIILLLAILEPYRT